MKQFLYFSFFNAVLLSATLYGSESEKGNAAEFLRNIGVGSVAGMAEVFANQPTILVKNILQQQKKSKDTKSPVVIFRETIQKNPRHLYRGLGVNLTCMVPTTALQVGVSEQLKAVIPAEDLTSSLARNGLAGALGAFVCNASELTIINQQKWETNAVNTIKRLYAENGVPVCMRGFMAKALRDAHFCAGFLTLYPLVKEYVQAHDLSSAVATVVASALVGPLTGAMSHPFDTISTEMQADPSKKELKGFADAMKAIYREGGFTAFFKGFTPRTMRIVVAIPLMNAVKQLFENR